MNPRALLCFATLALVFTSVPAAEPAGDWMAGYRATVVAAPDIPNRSVRITDFGAVADGRTLCTEAIARAIDAMVAHGGGSVRIPRGIWLTGPVTLKSKIALHLEDGALLQFSRDTTLFKAPGLIFGDNLTDIAITGNGIIDGAGDAWRQVKRSKMTEGQWAALVASGGRLSPDQQMWYPRKAGENFRPKLLELRNCKRVLLDRATFQNSPEWNLHPRFCEDVMVQHVNVRNPWYSQNGDGLDIDSCRNVVVRDTRLDVGDDAICLKSGAGAEARKTGRPTENVLIENCVVYHGHGGVTIGSEMSGGVRNVRVDNCTFVGTDIGLRFKTQRGRGGVVENIFISNVRMTDIPTDAISFNMYYGGAAPEDEASNTGEVAAAPVDDGTPQFRNIYIEDVICRGARRAVQLQGLPEMPIRGIHLRNVAITATRGLVCQDAQDITLRGVEIFNIQGPVAEIVRSRDVAVDGLTFTPGADTLFAVAGKNSANISVQHVDRAQAKTPLKLAAGATADAVRLQ